eukprot:CAMPEP_0174711618 /NCGR_PEP_ID=MMETSP1094-20130205/12882_1 /TAXON_ID=156173 /ORGANISM="Chrysochromulina brevifilum, Strain UTEX LB 985" /LENGTH=155 /DNA_ID=CAMNT_0015910581 /DNA_START=32 /DNA_END=499 /DNA_ORIENTATION=+
MRSILTVLGLSVSVHGFAVTARPPLHASKSNVCQPEMVLGYKLAAGAATATVVGGVVAIKKVLGKREDPAVAAFRGSLSSMDSLSGLSELKLELEGQVGRVAGVWKEYIKNDGRKWYYNTETGKMQWIVPEEFVKLDEVSAAAAAANSARGTSLS